MTISVFDIALVLVVLILCVKVTLTGFVGEFFSKAAVVAGGIAAVVFFRPLAAKLESLMGDTGYPQIVAFLSIFLLVYLVVKIIQGITGKAFENESMANLDRALGFFLGLGEGVLLAAVLLVGLRIQPWFDVSGLLSDSFFNTLIDPLLRDKTLRIMEFSASCLRM